MKSAYVHELRELKSRASDCSDALLQTVFITLVSL